MHHLYCNLYGIVALVIQCSAILRQARRRRITPSILLLRGSRTGVMARLIGRAMVNVSAWSASLALEICRYSQVVRSCSPTSSILIMSRWHLTASSSCITSDWGTRFLTGMLHNLTLHSMQLRNLYGIMSNLLIWSCFLQSISLVLIILRLCFVSV